MALTEFLLRPWRARIAALALAVLATVAALAWFPGVLQGIEERSASWVWRWADQGAVERRMVLVDIDEKSLQALGPWPWPRERLAELSRGLDAAGAQLKLFDVVLAGDKPGDAAVREALSGSASPIVLGQLFSLDPGNALRSGQLAGALPNEACPEASSTAYGYLANAASLGIYRAGHLTPRVDPDGMVRRVPALICYRGQTYPTLALAGLIQATGQDGPLPVRPGQKWLDPAWTVELPGIAIPLDAKGDVRVSYQLPRSAFTAVSAVDVIRHKVPGTLLQGAWTLVGSTAFGVGDAVPTPQGGAESGLFVHAELLSAILDDRVPYTPRIAALWPWLAGGLSALLLLGFCARRRFSVLALPAMALALLAVFFAVYAEALLKAHLWIGWVDPALFVLLAATALGVTEHARVRVESRRIYQNLASYLPAEVAAKVAYQAQSSRVEASHRDVTVMFVDLRNFSAFCKARPAEESATVLHVFFSTAAEIIAAHGGVVEHMVGDGIMAVWNGATPCTDHESRALAAAAALWPRCIAELPEIARFGLEPLDVGIGMESGVALVGSFGLAERRTHTVMGEPVSVASRLQAMTAELAYPVLVGEAMAQRVPRADLINLGLFLLDGLPHERIVYSLKVPFTDGRAQRLGALSLVGQRAA
ncbi:MAG: adenylate/guanylate cyclase domain-containing protein [Betaproteobacteria bacterium]|nr:adenylate/guanylate cyclase domain-containing protein [Betaproteobacteria bacterium]